MFQRLRQMVAHIFQVQDLLQKEFDSEHVEGLWKEMTESMQDADEQEGLMASNLQRMIDDRGKAPSDSDPMAFQGLNGSSSPTPQAEKPPRPKGIVNAFANHVRTLKRKKRWGE